MLSCRVSFTRGHLRAVTSTTHLHAQAHRRTRNTQLPRFLLAHITTRHAGGRNFVGNPEIMEIPEGDHGLAASTVLEPGPEQARARAADSSKKAKAKKDRTYKFSEVYDGLRRGELTVPLESLRPNVIWECANHATARRHFDFFESCARVFLETSAHYKYIIPLLLRDHIVHLDPRTAVALYEALSPNQHTLQAGMPFAHPGIIDNPSLLSKLARYYGGPVVRGERTWPHLDLLGLLTVHGLHTEAYGLLQRLIESGRVPPEALRVEETASHDFKAIVLSILARACLHFNLKKQAARYVSEILVRNEGESLQASVGMLAVDILDTLVVHGSPEEAQVAVYLCRTLMIHSHAPHVPADAVQKLYELLMEHQLVEEAAKLFSFTRRKDIRAIHEYPPPLGDALPWLMDYFVNGTKDTYRARMLGRHVANSSLPIHPTVRAPFISLLAESGCAVSARVLWERYAFGRLGAFVHANPRLTVSMCRLYMSLVHRERALMAKAGWKWKWERWSPGSSQEGPEAGNMTALEGVRGDLKMIGSAYSSERYLERPAEGSVSGRGLHKKRSLFVEPLSASWARHDNFVAFARLVVESFRASKEPVNRANQADLNALACAYFTLGEPRSGFDALNRVNQRSQKSDQYDANVAIGAVANEKSGVGVKTLHGMVQSGRKIDSVTIGTVLHHALKQGDFDTVKDVLITAREHDLALDLKTVGSIIRFSVEYARGDTVALEDTLRRALVVLMSNSSLPYIDRVKTCMICTWAALDAGFGALAYDFWNMTIRSRAQFADPEQRKLRRRIAEVIRDQREIIGGQETDSVLQTLDTPHKPGGPRDVSGVLKEYEALDSGPGHGAHADVLFALAHSTEHHAYDDNLEER